MRSISKLKSNKSTTLIVKSLPYVLGTILLISSYLFFKTGTGPLSFLSKKTEINAVGTKCKVEKDEYMECTDPNGKKTVTTYTDGHVSNISTTSTIVERDPDKGVVGRTTVVNSRDTTYNGSTGTYQTTTGGTNTTVIQETKYKKKDDGEVEEEKGEIVTRVIQNNNTPQETVKITVKDNTGTVKQEQTFNTGAGEVPKLTAAAAKLPTQTGKGSCATSGNPIQEGTWAATGTYSDNGSPSPETALCKQCGADGSFSGETKACLSVVGTAPIVLPSHMEVIKTKDGNDVPFKKCFAKIDGVYMQVAPGDEVKGDESTKYCSPEGKLVDTKDEAMQIICSLNGQIASGGKCADKPQTPVVPPVGNQGKLSGLELAAAIRDCTSSPNKAGETSYFDNTTGQCLTKKSADACRDRASKENKAGSVVWYTCNGDKTTITTCLEGSYAADGTCVRRVVPTGIKDQLPTICVYPRIPKLDANGRGTCELAPTNFGAVPPVNSTTPATPLLITDNSSEKALPPGSKCADGMYNTILGNVAYKPKCQKQCEGGVYTTVSYGMFGIKKVVICGNMSDSSLITTVNALKLSENNVKILEDNKSELTTKKLSKCSNEFNSENLCSRCEVGVVTDVETSSGTFRFCGSKDEVSNLVNSNPSLLTPDQEDSSSGYVPYPPYNQENKDKDNAYVPYPLYNQQNDEAFNFEDMPGISEAQEKSGAAGSAIGEALLKAGSQIWNTITGIGQGTTNSYQNIQDDLSNATKSTVPGSLQRNDKCFVHSDCGSGLVCKTVWGNWRNAECAEAPIESVKNYLIGQDGKFSVGTPCYDNDQCESGATCKKTWLPDTCQPKSVPAGGSVVEDKDHKYKILPTGAGIYSYSKDGIVYIILPPGYSENDLIKLNSSTPEKE